MVSAPLVERPTPRAAAERPRPARVAEALLRTVAYADLFDFPLTLAEAHRYLDGCAASLAEVGAALVGAASLHQVDGFVLLRGRGEIVAMRQRRAAVAARLWPRAHCWGQRIARLPFVRMVGVTGALAVGNVEPGADIDFLVVTEPGRLWLCRALVVLLVRQAARSGDLVCPNYFLSERRLSLAERTLFSARELAQLVPLAGWPIYQRLRRLNGWALALLPNAAGPPCPPLPDTPPPAARRLAEAALRSPPAGWLDRWEMGRKVRKFERHYGRSAEAAFAPDWCKGHFDGHRGRILREYEGRLRALGLDDAP